MMGKHGKTRPLWPELLGLGAAVICVGLFLWLVIFYRQWKP
jgi:hypothetical protein